MQDAERVLAGPVKDFSEPLERATLAEGPLRGRRHVRVLLRDGQARERFRIELELQAHAGGPQSPLGRPPRVGAGDTRAAAQAAIAAVAPRASDPQRADTRKDAGPRAGAAGSSGRATEAAAS